MLLIAPITFSHWTACLLSNSGMAGSSTFPVHRVSGWIHRTHCSIHPPLSPSLTPPIFSPSSPLSFSRSVRDREQGSCQGEGTDRSCVLIWPVSFRQPLFTPVEQNKPRMHSHEHIPAPAQWQHWQAPSTRDNQTTLLASQMEPYSLHSADGPWSKVMHYVGNWVPLREAATVTGEGLQLFHHQSATWWCWLDLRIYCTPDILHFFKFVFLSNSWTYGNCVLTLFIPVSLLYMLNSTLYVKIFQSTRDMRGIQIWFQ